MEELNDLSTEDFVFFSDLLFRLSGISLKEQKLTLVRSRLRSHIQRLGMRAYSEYREYLAGREVEDVEFQSFINLLTTNKTEFFREPRHFDYVADVLVPEWVSRQKKEVKVWCCASSTGQEPYTLALVLDHHLPKDVDFRILATDIDTEVLDRAHNGVYPASELHSIPHHYQTPHVRLGTGKAEGWFKISDEIHRKVRFERHNLNQTNAPGDGPFDLIFCRNVLIYFSRETVRSIISKLSGLLEEEGALIVGHSESIHGNSHLLKTVKPSIFKKIKR
jgi:chemotaxis methyl-accepting protein methylase